MEISFLDEQYLLQQEKIPQRLNNEVFFGSINLLNDINFINDNNIHFFITDNIPISDLLKFNCLNDSDNFLFINFNSQFNINNFNEKFFLDNNLLKFQKIITKLIEERKNEFDDIRSYLYDDIHNYYKTTIFNDEYKDRFIKFNDILTIFKKFDKNLKVLTLSNTNNYEPLFTLLVSNVLKNNPNFKTLEALQFVKSMRNNDYPMKDEKIFWCPGLVDFFKIVRSKEINWGLNNAMYGYNSPISKFQYNKNANIGNYNTKRYGLPSPSTITEEVKRARS